MELRKEVAYSLGDPMVRYPWKKWMAVGKRRTIRRGVDYDCETRIMIQQIRNRAVADHRCVNIIKGNDPNQFSFKVTANAYYQDNR